MLGSPSCNLTTSFPFSAFSFRILKMSSRTIFAASCSCDFLHILMISGGMSEPEYTTTSAFWINFFAFTVISSGSPGPQPTKYTLCTLYHHDGEIFRSHCICCDLAQC